MLGGIAVGAGIHGFVPQEFLVSIMGTALAFMMGVVALSLPEMIILRKVLKLRLMATFVAIVTCGILAVGFILNAIL